MVMGSSMASVSAFVLMAATLHGVATGEEVCSGAQCFEEEPSSLLQKGAGLPEALLSKEASKTTALTEIQQNYIVVNGRGFSRYNAHRAELGAIGEEFKNTAYIPPRLEFAEHPQDAWIKGAAFGSSARIASSQENAWGIDLKTNAIPQVDIEAGLDGNSSHDASFYLMEVSLPSMYALMKALNKKEFEDYRKYLATKLDRPRIVTSVWILIEGDEEHASFCAGGKLVLDVDNMGSIDVHGEGCKMSTWKMSPDSVMAYSTHKIKFAKDYTVDDLDPDRATR